MRLTMATGVLSGLAAFAAACLVVAGVASTAWPKASARITLHESSRVAFHSYRTPRAAKSSAFSVERSDYLYEVDGVTYRNHAICFCLALGSPAAHFDKPPRVVAYLRSDPRISVLFPGPDLVSVSLLLLLSAALFVAGRALDAHLAGTSTATFEPPAGG